MEDKSVLMEHGLHLQRDLTSYEDSLLLPLKVMMVTKEPACPKRVKALGDAAGYILAIEDAKTVNRRLKKAKDFIGTPGFQA